MTIMKKVVSIQTETLEIYWDNFADGQTFPTLEALEAEIARLQPFLEEEESLVLIGDLEDLVHYVNMGVDSREQFFTVNINL